jgi:hypothetical protein
MASLRYDRWNKYRRVISPIPCLQSSKELLYCEYAANTAFLLCKPSSNKLLMVQLMTISRIIAVMLGRLRMSLDECEKAYLTLSKKIFTPRRSSFQWFGRGMDFLQANGRFDARILEIAMKECIGNYTDTEALFKNPGSPCKV